MACFDDEVGEDFVEAAYCCWEGVGGLRDWVAEGVEELADCGGAMLVGYSG